MKLLVLALTWPEPSATAAGQRLLQLLAAFKSFGYQIMVASAAQETGNEEDLAALGYSKEKIQLNNPSFDSFIYDLQPNLVLFDRYITEEQFGWRVAENCPQAIQILDTEDLHSLRHVREKLFKENEEFTVAKWLAHEKTKREIASIYRCDLSLIISSFEMDLLINEVKINKDLLLYLPLMADPILKNTIGPSFEDRSDFIFIGGGKHSPNLDAIIYLKQQIWPGIRSELPKAKLMVYGAYFPQKIKELHRPEEGFLCMGSVMDAEEVMKNARVSIAPLRFGAGIKGKLWLSMQCGTPTVTTTIGAEGMHADLPWNGSIANDKEHFIAASVSLYTQKELWQKAQENGRELINTLYDKQHLIGVLKNRIAILQKDLLAHRDRNFIGQLLRFHTLNATRYMAKWIAAKNK